ncbi:MAG: DUF2812 domain-containing protein [Clostridiales bacterium]|nr:DUF2812 domain-containing protein [Clostridiales bacterium]
MSRNRKRVFKLHSIVEYKNLEAYFEEMASKGWMLKEIRKGFYVFDKVESVALDFSVNVFYETGPFDFPDNESEKTLIEFCEDSGWHHCTGTPMYQVFYKDKDEDVIPLHTEPEEEYRYIKKIVMKTELYLLPMILMFLGMGYININFFSYEDIFSNATMISRVWPFCIALLFGITVYTPLIWLIKNRINLSQNNNLMYFSNRHIKIKYTLYYCLTGIYLILVGLMFFDSFSTIGLSMLPLLLLILLPMIAAVFMMRRFKRVKRDRLKNMLMYVVVSIGVVVFSIAAVIFIISSDSIHLFNGKLKEERVLELSDFGEYEVADTHLFKRHSVFTPVYIEYYERIDKSDKSSDVQNVETVYIKCINEKVAEYVFDNTLKDQLKYEEADYKLEEIPLALWSVDEGYYLFETKEKLVLRKDKTVIIIDGDMDFTDDNIIEICKSKLKIDSNQ